MATTCTILSDKAVRSILINLRRDQVEKFRDDIGSSLIDFSTSEERQYQPDSSTVVRPDGRSILFRPFTSRDGPGIKIIVDPTTPGPAKGTVAATSGPPPTLHGVLVVCDAGGLPKGLVNADEITAFRTSMSVMIPYSWRRRTARVVIFGAGKVALWHVRLMLALRGEDIKRVTMVNRSAGRAEELVKQIRQENQQRRKSETEFEMLATADSDQRARLEGLVKQADVVCCTTPVSKPLFPAEWVIQGGRSPFVAAIGSWQPAMVEVDPELLRHAAIDRAGSVVVDDRGSALQVSGEVIQSGLRSDQLLELGELLAARRSQTQGKSETLTKSHLEEGLMVYKSVGVSITDLAAANAVLALAKEGSHGVHIDDF